MPSSTRRRPPPPPPAWTPEPWSDGETSALLEAWGPRHLRARGGPLHPADWRACAAAVTARRAAAGRAPRTVEQCKNRVDYLKKRLRAERKRHRSKGLPPAASGCLSRLRTLLQLAPSAPPGFAKLREPRRRRRATQGREGGGGGGGGRWRGGGRNCAEVAAALDRLAGTYERVEAAKQREAARLEERRLEAMRDLEIERMRLLVDVAVTASVGVDSSSAAAAAGDF
ncbi:hypothetical protein PR202_ga26060 [Eleusine coracana subsp. coracana]|uniref:Myb/SANT-like DNA-binding domain-containing protein n=1 Tax=Eleusine coracana subsp. coracana TaxID=191504 RepID=A0AAV5DD25_ELECO|nr:hypothetical protein PR202_ga26060 [Eleusine coracana subsp. coracana]